MTSITSSKPVSSKVFDYVSFVPFRFNQNYGVFGVLDRLHGTDEQFRQSKNYERHVVLLGLNPAKQLFPNTRKGKAD